MTLSRPSSACWRLTRRMSARTSTWDKFSCSSANIKKRLPRFASRSKPNRITRRLCIIWRPRCYAKVSAKKVSNLSKNFRLCEPAARRPVSDKIISNKDATPKRLLQPARKANLSKRISRKLLLKTRTSVCQMLNCPFVIQRTRRKKPQISNLPRRFSILTTTVI